MMGPLGRWAGLLLVGLVAACDGAAPEQDAGGAACVGDPDVPIGGDFTLVDHNGETVTQDVLTGRYSLVYFGFTHCPDVCPTELQRMTAALDTLSERGKNLERVQPAFISVDPKRDTPEVVKQYISLFHPRLIGLTGSKAQVDTAASAFRVFHSIDGDPESDSYLVNHTSMIFFLDRQGRYIAHFTAEDSPEAVADRVGQCL